MTSAPSSRVRWAGLLLACCAFAPVASGYYHFIKFATTSGPYTPIVDKFDLSALADRTVPYFVSDKPPSSMAEGNSMASVISQIRAAADVWNGVRTSEIRLGFGGLRPTGTPMNAPAVEIVFDDLTPGLIAMSGPTVVSDPVPGKGFQPIVKSVMVLGQIEMQRTSFGERFFLTLVHEFGHTLGLQHTWCSSVMSTEITRAVTKASPLGADDIAGISSLYPAPGYLAATGSITGRVTLNDNGVNLASVVALTSSGPAISAITNPDGSYRIDGLAPGSYIVFAHPLPPAYAGEMQPVNIVLPTDPTGPLSPGPAFNVQFYPQSQAPSLSVLVTAGQVSDGISFAVQARDHVSLHSVQSYSFYSGNALKPAEVLLGSEFGRLVFYGEGMSTGSGPLPGLSATVLSAPEVIDPSGIQFYSPVSADASYLQMDVRPNPFSAAGPRHLLFSLNGESYVLPSALWLVRKNPPSITAATPNPDRTVVLAGTNLDASTSIWFDGVRAAVQQVTDGTLTVVPPPAASTYKATIVALNPDGQSSLFVSGNDSPTYTYDPADAPQISIAPASLPTGVETVIEVNGQSASFRSGLADLGLGSSDVSVHRVWVTSPNHLYVNVSLNPAGLQGANTVTTVSGLLLDTQPGAFQILPATGKEMFVPLSTLGAVSFLAGGDATLPVANLPGGATLPSVIVTVNGIAAQPVSVEGNQVHFQMPAGLSPGPALVKMTANGDTVWPIVVQIDPPPPLLLSVQTLSGFPVTSNSPAHLGDQLQLVVSGLLAGGYVPNKTPLHLTSDGLEHNIVQVIPNPDQSGTYLIQFTVNPNSPVDKPLPLTLTLNGRSGQSYLLPVQ
jgi:uncharacterized protein (TIGR03437 family)